MLLEIEVLWWPEDYDPDDESTKYKKLKMVPGPLVIASDHIVGFSPHDNGHALVRLSSGDVFETTIEFDTFCEVMEGVELKKDMLVSGEN
jgi:hypothetical protein